MSCILPQFLKRKCWAGRRCDHNYYANQSEYLRCFMNFLDQISREKSLSYKDVLPWCLRNKSSTQNKLLKKWPLIRHLLDILKKLPFQVCLLGMSTPVLEALAPTQGHLGHQSCSATVLSQFPEFCCHPCSSPSLTSGHLPWPVRLSRQLPHLIQMNKASVRSKTGAQVFAAALVIRDKMCRQPACPSMGEWIHQM